MTDETEDTETAGTGGELQRTTGNAIALRNWKPAFLEDLELHGVVSYAAKAAGVARSTVYDARLVDDAFAVAWDNSHQVALDGLEREAWRRAAEGTLEPLVSGGKHVADVRKYSDRLLEFLLKAHRPEKFRERYAVEHSGGLTLSQLAATITAERES